jgi:hypothetical protein
MLDSDVCAVDGQHVVTGPRRDARDLHAEAAAARLLILSDHRELPRRFAWRDRAAGVVHHRIHDAGAIQRTAGQVEIPDVKGAS